MKVTQRIVPAPRVEDRRLEKHTAKGVIAPVPERSWMANVVDHPVRCPEHGELSALEANWTFAWFPLMTVAAY
ncbi:hypothetical protein ACWGS9_34865, partial [Bradyrhizobium sp. Arg314]